MPTETRGPIITNMAGLPQPIVDAVTNDPYESGACDITVTQLIGPPQIRHLRQKHQSEITEDAADRIWALLGQSVHAVIERARGNESLQEMRLYMDVDGYRITGQMDDFDMMTGVLTDYKLTTVWRVVNGDFAEWTAQLNLYAELARRAGGEPTQLQILAMFRDWSKMAVLRNGNGYPKQQATIIPIELWPSEKTIAYTRERLRLHFADPIPPCTDEDRWNKPDTWAVKKKGNKRALKLHDSLNAAEEMVEAASTGVDLVIEHRPGEATRCEHYCAVAPFCLQFNKEVHHETDSE